jgi:hypothetical protein
MPLQLKSLKKTKMKKPSEVFKNIRSSAMQEDLRKWFDKDHPEGGWKRINSKGEAVGPCAREPGEPKPKCMSNEKRAKLSKKERAAAVATKRKHDPNPERKGEPINVSNFGKGKISEDMENLEEKNVPTSPEKWAQAKAQAKAKFDVYPSAYANGWAAKKYKSMGGGWKSVSEAVKDKFDIGEYDQEGDMAKSDLRSIMANAKRVHDMLEDSTNLPEWVQSKITLAEDYISTVANYMTSEMSEEVVVEEDIRSARIIKSLYKKKGVMKEEQQLDELSKDTYKDYLMKTRSLQKKHHAGSQLSRYGYTGAKDRDLNTANARVHAKKMLKKEEVGQMNESGGDVVYKKGEHHIEKYGEDVFALYKNGKKQKNYTSIQAAKSAISEDVEQLDELSKDTLKSYRIKSIGRASDFEKKGYQAAKGSAGNDKSDKLFNKADAVTAARKRAQEKLREDEQIEEGKMKDIATNREEDKRLGSWRKETPWMKVKSTVTDKSGAKHTPMSRARDLARAAAKKNVKESVSISESRLADIVREAADNAKKKKKEAQKDKDVSDDKFQKDPELSTQIIRND